jgi:hypothetical protein
MSGEDDDPQLRALRAVWLAMPDEDPPSRGLDALMAAARVKAEQMTEPEPSWWRRVLDVLRKPPVLALASVMVLIGGAVLISQRTEVAEMQRERVQQQPAAPTSTAAPAATPIAPAKAPETVPENPHGGAVDHYMVPPKPIAPQHDGAKHVELKPPNDVTAPAFTPTTPKKPTAQNKPKVDSVGGENEGVANGQDAATDDKDATRGPRQVMVDDLLVQSRSAAARGDCESSRLIAKRIQNQDLAFYRTRVTTDTAIQKCIAAAATTLSE